ncbi:MAG: T9SS type A sorting domain-containing protein, partial [Bacteroidota bacterium]
SMTFIDTTGIEAAKKDFSFNIYPNPSNGVFNLIISADNQKSKNYYTIYDILGNIVFRKKLIPELGDNFNEKIDLTYLGTGLYFIELSINGVRTTKKLVKN